MSDVLDRRSSEESVFGCHEMRPSYLHYVQNQACDRTQAMKYNVGQKLLYIPDSKFEKPSIVQVTDLRKGGRAKLSNGRVADESGLSEGTKSSPGGKVLP